MQHLKEIVLPNYPLILSLLKYRNMWVFWNQNIGMCGYFGTKKNPVQIGATP